MGTEVLANGNMVSRQGMLERRMKLEREGTPAPDALSDLFQNNSTAKIRAARGPHGHGLEKITAKGFKQKRQKTTFDYGTKELFPRAISGFEAVVKDPSKYSLEERHQAAYTIFGRVTNDYLRLHKEAKTMPPRTPESMAMEWEATMSGTKIGQHLSPLLEGMDAKAVFLQASEAVYQQNAEFIESWRGPQTEEEWARVRANPLAAVAG